jgi:integrase
MPKIAKELSSLEVKRLNKIGHHAVGGVSGLLLQITKNGAKSWILRTIIGARRRDVGLGGFPGVTLAMARDKAREAKELVAKGIDPIERKKSIKAQLIASQASSLTFDEAAEKFHRSKSTEFRNAKHAAQWISTIKTYASPVIGRLPVSNVELAHIVKILEPIWLTKTETASRLRGRIESVLAWATVSGFRAGDNPARWQGNLDVILPKPGKIAKVVHHKALPIDSMKDFMVDLRKREGVAARALEFLILTACRSGEVRGSTWNEIDLEGKTWTIPASRMKAGREHRVPLSDSAMKILSELPRISDNDLVFPAPRSGQLSDMSLSAVLRRMGVDAVPHGFRSTFRDWCSETTSYSRYVSEMSLAHTIGDKVEAAYRRGDLFAKRTKLMQAWDDFLHFPTQAGQVVQINKIKNVT